MMRKKITTKAGLACVSSIPGNSKWREQPKAPVAGPPVQLAALRSCGFAKNKTVRN
jgi:hypothetical protein